MRVNLKTEHSLVQSERSRFRLGILGVAAVAVVAGVPFLSQQLAAIRVAAPILVAVEATTVFLCLLVAMLGLQRFGHQHVADSWFVALGAAGLGLSSAADVVLQSSGQFQFAVPGILSGVSFAAAGRLFLSVYLLLAAFNGRNLVPDRKLGRWVIGGSMSALLIWLASASLPLVLLPAAERLHGLPFPAWMMLDGTSALLAAVAFVSFTREVLREQSGAQAAAALASTAVLSAAITAVLNPAAGAGSPWEAAVALAAAALLLISLAAEQVRFVTIETSLRRQVSQANEALAKSERAYRTLVENLGEGVATLDRDGRIVYANPQLARLLETGVESLRGKLFSDWVNRDQLPILRSEFRRLAAKEPRQFEIDLATAQKRRTGVVVNAAPVVAHGRHPVTGRADDRFLGAQLLVSDLTQRRRAEQRLSELMDKKAQHLRLYEQCIENVTEGIFVLNREHRVSYVNRAFEEMTGYLRSEVEDRKAEELLTIPDGGEESELWRRVDSGRSWRDDVVNHRKDGAEFVADVSLVPLREGEGAPSGYLGVLRDITQQKRLERTLTESAERLRRKSEEIESAKNYYEALIAGMTDILMVVDAEGRCTFVNEYGCKRLGYSTEEIANSKLPPFFSDLKRLEKSYGGSMELKDYEYPLTTRDGEVLHCSWYARPLFDLRGRRIGAMAVGRDITEFKRLQDQLKEHARNLEENVQELYATWSGALAHAMGSD